MDLTSDIHKYFRDLRQKKGRVLPKIQSDDKEPKRGTIRSFLAHALPKKRNVIFLLRLLINPYK